ncbi:hypothetical protein [Lapidilactobacillus bayanensis]|uniref:hypothetical protein n=1 Tax=Lapidilactobacillus bayanensis TaxID=2485998 RepID=UPI000F771914|nr:hypothetical protein [Lapidilactobacillus bayanensis]
MATYTPIEHGKPNWDTVVNQNFKNIDADTNWVSLTINAPFTGTMQFRRRFNIVQISGSISATETVDANVVIATLPVNVYRNNAKTNLHYVVNAGDSTNIANVSLNNDGSVILIQTSADITKTTIKISITAIVN